MTTHLTRRAIARSVLAGVAAVPALAIPTLAEAVTTDPVFAAIEKLRAAHAYHGECLIKADAIEQKIWARRRANLAVPRKDVDEMESLRDRGVEVEGEARAAFLAIRPTSRAGAAAMVSFFSENYEKGLDCFWEEHAVTLIEAVGNYLRSN